MPTTDQFQLPIEFELTAVFLFAITGALLAIEERYDYRRRLRPRAALRGRWRARPRRLLPAAGAAAGPQGRALSVRRRARGGRLFDRRDPPEPLPAGVPAGRRPRARHLRRRRHRSGRSTSDSTWCPPAFVGLANAIGGGVLRDTADPEGDAALQARRVLHSRGRRRDWPCSSACASGRVCPRSRRRSGRSPRPSLIRLAAVSFNWQTRAATPLLGRIDAR